MKNNKLLKFRIYLTIKSLEAYTKYKNSKKRIGPFFFVFLGTEKSLQETQKRGGCSCYLLGFCSDENKNTL